MQDARVCYRKYSLPSFQPEQISVTKLPRMHLLLQRQARLCRLLLFGSRRSLDGSKLSYGETEFSMNTKNIFFVGLVVAASGLISTPLALLAGLIYGMSFAHPYHVDAKKLSAFLLKASIVGLGFGMNLHEVVRAGRSGFAYTALSITFAMLLGLGIGRLFKVQHIPSLLISTGTAICGGSAIAAVGPVVNAGEEAMAVSLGTVFVLNSVALFLFPVVG